jgi:3-dehydroquinate dehydratase
MPEIPVPNGPNLNLLGSFEPANCDTASRAGVERPIEARAAVGR